MTPLADAAARGYIHILEMLIEKGANLNSTGVIGKVSMHIQCHFVIIALFVLASR